MSIAFPLFTEPVIAAQKAGRVGRHDLSLLSPCWLFPVVCLFFTCPVTASRRYVHNLSRLRQPACSSLDPFSHFRGNICIFAVFGGLPQRPQPSKDGRKPQLSLLAPSDASRVPWTSVLPVCRPRALYNIKAHTPTVPCSVASSRKCNLLAVFFWRTIHVFVVLAGRLNRKPFWSPYHCFATESGTVCREIQVELFFPKKTCNPPHPQKLCSP